MTYYIESRLFKAVCTSSIVKNNEIFTQFMLVLTLNHNLLLNEVHIHINKQKHEGHRLCIIQTTWKAREDMERGGEAVA